MSTASAQGGALGTIVDRMGLKTLVESCLVLEEGVASAKDIEVGMMMGAGMLPGPFARADDAGLDTILEQLERAQAEWGDAYEPPTVLRRLVAQGRLGTKPWPTRATSARPCCSRPAVTSRSRGSTGRRRTRSRPRPCAT